MRVSRAAAFVTVTVLVLSALIAHAPTTPGPWWLVPGSLLGVIGAAFAVVLLHRRHLGIRLADNTRKAVLAGLGYVTLRCALAAAHRTWSASALIAFTGGFTVAAMMPTYRVNLALRRLRLRVGRAPTRANIDALVAFARGRPHPSVRYVAAFPLLDRAPREAASLLDELLTEDEVCDPKVVAWFAPRRQDLRLLRAWAALRLEDLDGARAALAMLSADLPPKQETTRRLLASCIHSWEGRGGEALALLPTDDAPSMIRNLWPVARAHALVGSSRIRVMPRRATATTHDRARA